MTGPRCALVLLLGVCAAAAAAQSRDTQVRDAPVQATEPAVPPALEPGPLPEVTVSAPEPRYVAPTLRDRIGRIWAPVYIDGRGPYRLVLDTGANRSVIVDRVARELGEGARSDTLVRVRGVTGEAVVPVARAERLEIGDLLIAPINLPIVADVFGGADGILGNEGLRDKRIVIDFRRDSITIKRSRRERVGPGFQKLPITFRHQYLILVDVLIGNVRAKAVIDTGAPDSLGNTALLEALRRSLKNAPETDIVGVTLDVERGNRVRMPVIRMGDVTVRGASFTFSDVHIFRHWRMTREPALMLGMDVLGLVDQIIIDYRTRELHLRMRDSMRGGGPATAAPGHVAPLHRN
jgi:hypothetical protein